MFKRIICLLVATALCCGLGRLTTGTVTAQEMDFTMQEIPVDSMLVMSQLSPAGDVIAAYESAEINNFEPQERYLWLIDAATGETLTTFTEPTDYATAVAFTADGSTLASLHTNGDIHLWDVGNQALIRTFNPGFYSLGRFAQFLPDNQTLVFLNNNNFGQVVFLDTETGYITKILSPRFETRQALTDTLSEATGRFSYLYSAAALASDGASIALANASDALFLWDINTEQQISLRPEAENKGLLSISALHYAADGTLLAYSNPREEQVTVLDPATGTAQAVLDIAADAFALSPDGTHVVWISRDEGRLYYAALDAVDQPVSLLELPENLRLAPRLTSLQFSPDGNRLLLSGLFGQDESTLLYTFTLGT